MLYPFDESHGLSATGGSTSREGISSRFITCLCGIGVSVARNASSEEMDDLLHEAHAEQLQLPLF